MGLASNRDRDSLGGIKQLLNQNRPLLAESIRRTESLKQSHPEITFPASIYSEEYCRSFYSNAPSIARDSNLDFEFDDLVINSQVYRRVLASARRKPPESTGTQHIALSDLIDLSSDPQTIIVEQMNETTRDLEGLVVLQDGQPLNADPTPSTSYLARNLELLKRIAVYEGPERETAQNWDVRVRPKSLVQWPKSLDTALIWDRKHTPEVLIVILCPKEEKDIRLAALDSVVNSDYLRAYFHVFLSFDGDEDYLNTIEALGIPRFVGTCPKPIEVMYKSIRITVSRFPSRGELYCQKATLKLIHQGYPKYRQQEKNRLILFINSDCVLDRNFLQKRAKFVAMNPSSLVRSVSTPLFKSFWEGTRVIGSHRGHKAGLS